MNDPLVYVYFPPEHAFAWNKNDGKAIYKIGCIVAREGTMGGYPALFKNHVSSNVLFTLSLKSSYVTSFEHRLQQHLVAEGCTFRTDLGQGHVIGAFPRILRAIMHTVLEWIAPVAPLLPFTSTNEGKEGKEGKEESDMDVEGNDGNTGRKNCMVDVSHVMHGLRLQE